jgi:hypothetical protein
MLDTQVNFFGNLGTCKLSNFYPSEYCSITNSIQLIVTDSEGEVIYSWWIWVCVTIGGIVLSVAVWIVSCRYFNKKQNEFESLASQRKNKNNMSTLGKLFVLS